MPAARAEQAATVALELVISVALGAGLAALEIMAPHLYKRLGLLKSAWPADPVPVGHTQIASDQCFLAEQHAQTAVEECLKPL